MIKIPFGDRFGEEKTKKAKIDELEEDEKKDRTLWDMFMEYMQTKDKVRKDRLIEALD